MLSYHPSLITKQLLKLSISDEKEPPLPVEVRDTALESSSQSECETPALHRILPETYWQFGTDNGS